MQDKNKYFGVMLDMSRNGVMKVEEVKKYATLISKMGYNMLQLYMEDIYEIEGEPYFGYLRGRYTQKELKEIVEYCESIGVEVVPCIQTLAHLENALRWKVYDGIVDAVGILLAENERTYEFIERMVKSLRECFTSKHIHIGMDEAFMLGLGRYLELHGYQDRIEILRKHLDRVMQITKKYDFKPLMWSDMFFRLANNGQYYPEQPQLPEEVVKIIPKDLGIVYWDYFTNDKEYYKKMMKAHLQAGDNVWFAGGAWTWAGFASGNSLAIETMMLAMQAASECGINNILLTLWGDFGRECSYYSVLPALFTIRKAYDGITDVDQIRKEFKEIVGEDYDAMMNLDIPNYVGGNKCVMSNICKHMFYSDPFLGFLDSTVVPRVEEEYKAHAKTLLKGVKGSQFAYLFEMLSALCDVMSIKYSLGVRTRKVYKEKNREKLTILVDDYTKVLEYLEIFYERFKSFWDKECKPNGFEVHDIRIGGLKQRIMHCRQRLVGYLNGTIDEIPELDEEILDYHGRGKEFSAKRITETDNLYYTDYNAYRDRPPYLTSWSGIAGITTI